MIYRHFRDDLSRDLVSQHLSARKAACPRRFPALWRNSGQGVPPPGGRTGGPGVPQELGRARTWSATQWSTAAPCGPRAPPRCSGRSQSPPAGRTRAPGSPLRPPLVRPQRRGPARRGGGPAAARNAPGGANTRRRGCTPVPVLPHRGCPLRGEHAPQHRPGVTLRVRDRRRVPRHQRGHAKGVCPDDRQANRPSAGAGRGAPAGVPGGGTKGRCGQHTSAGELGG